VIILREARAERTTDATAVIRVPSADVSHELGPHFINAGSYYCHLDVVSLAFTQHS
jgi:hypothetical protein